MISHKIQDSFRDFYPRRSLQKRAFQMKLPQPVQIPLERAASKLNIKLTYFDSNSPIGLQILGGYSWWSFTDTKDLQNLGDLVLCWRAHIKCFFHTAMSVCKEGYYISI